MKPEVERERRLLYVMRSVSRRRTKRLLQGGVSRARVSGAEFNKSCLCDWEWFMQYSQSIAVLWS